MVDIQRLQALVTELHEQNYLYILCYDSAEFHQAIYQSITKPENIVQRVMNYVKVDVQRQERLLALIKARFPKMYQKHFPPKKLSPFELEQLQKEIAHTQEMIEQISKKIMFIQKRLDMVDPNNLNAQFQQQLIIDDAKKTLKDYQTELKQLQEQLNLGVSYE